MRYVMMKLQSAIGSQYWVVMDKESGQRVLDFSYGSNVALSTRYPDAQHKVARAAQRLNRRNHGRWIATTPVTDNQTLITGE